jgi:hypothetical protein
MCPRMKLSEHASAIVDVEDTVTAAGIRLLLQYAVNR